MGREKMEAIDQVLHEAQKHLLERRRQLGINARTEPEVPIDEVTSNDVWKTARPGGKQEKIEVAEEHPNRKPEKKAIKYPRGYGKVYQSIFETPEYCQLNHRDHKVYHFLAAYRNAKTGIARPGYENILIFLNRCKPPGRERDYDIKAVSRSIRSLEEAGLVRRVSKACKGRTVEIWVAIRAEDVNGGQ